MSRQDTATEKKRNARAGRPVVLLVEDDAGFAYATSRILEQVGLEVVVLLDVNQSLDVLESGRAIDLLLTDVRMPGMPHGFALARLARQRRPQLKVLYVTAVRDLPPHELEGALGKVLYKPVPPDVLVREVQAALED
jgi:CheY-like chemotaxis protein